MKMMMVEWGLQLKMCRFYKSGESYDVNCGREEHGFSSPSSGSANSGSYFSMGNLEQSANYSPGVDL